MHNVLVIAPSSVPVFGAEAIVNAKLLQLLGANGYKIDLISKKNKWENYPSQDNLEKLGIKLKRIKVIEVDNKLNLKTLVQHILVFFTFGTVFKGAHWAYKVIVDLKSFLENREYDYVLTKNSPSLLVGYYLKKKFGYKWVASWNDPYPGIKYPEPYGEGVDARLPFFNRKILKIMEKADLHVFPSKRLETYMKQYIKIPENRSLVIPHIAVRPNEITTNESPVLTMLHSGNVCSPRDPKPLALGIKKFLQEMPHAKIRVDFVGVYNRDFQDFINDNNLQNHVVLLPPLSYQENLGLIKKYSLAVIIEADCSEGIFLPTKVGDYMQSNMPIFSISPKEGVLNDLYREGTVQYFADIKNVGSIYNELKTIYSDYETGGLKMSSFKEEFSSDSVLKAYMSIPKTW